MDQNVGRILKELEDQNLLDDTLFIYTSDHGKSELNLLSIVKWDKSGYISEISNKFPLKSLFDDEVQRLRNNAYWFNFVVLLVSLRTSLQRLQMLLT